MQGLFDGRGHHIRASVDEEYEGQFLRGERHGEGHLLSSEVNYNGGVRATACLASCVRRRRHRGLTRAPLPQFKDGLFHGTGEATWADGTVYAGVWVADQPQGEGTLTIAATSSRASMTTRRGSLEPPVGQWMCQSDARVPGPTLILLRDVSAQSDGPGSKDCGFQYRGTMVDGGSVCQ